MNRIFGILCITILLQGSVSCLFESSDENENIKNKDNEIRFKYWLKDTLSQLTNNRSLNYKQNIKVSPDSLYMEVLNSYNIIVDSTYEVGNRELDYALDLLNRNKLLPAKSFRLLFAINNYFSKSMVERLIYDYDSEIMEFDIVYQDTLVELKFSKGNLIGRKITEVIK